VESPWLFRSWTSCCLALSMLLRLDEHVGSIDETGYISGVRLDGRDKISDGN